MANVNTNENKPPEMDDKDLNLDNFTKDGFKCLTGAIKLSNALPIDSDWNFYKLNESFCRITNNEGERLSKLINSILRRYDIDESVNIRKSFKDKIELIIEANDTILEKVNDNLDELNGIKKRNIQPVEFQTVTAELPAISGSWNRINKATFSVSPLVNLPKQNSSSSKSIHLLTGKNIIRPQTYFKDKIDNSNNYPWQPRITEKPNNIRPLALYLEESEFGDVFCHPYEMELDQFEPPTDQLKAVKLVEPKPIVETPLHHIETADKLDEVVEELLKHSVIAVDLEHHSYRTFLGITCLMQISTREADYIIDTLQLRDKLFVLNEVFTKPSIVKVFHGADCDIPWLQRDLSLYVVNMFDTHQAAKQLGYSGLSLAYLLQRFCKFMPNKQFQLADWRIRPLPQELIDYAREDTHYLIYLYEVLKNELLKQGNNQDNILKSVIQKSTEICKKTYIKPILNSDSHLDFYRKCKRLFDNKQMFALKELYQWRDKIAREEDESTGYVLPNHMLLQIAEVLPREMQGILACCNPIPPLVKSNLLELHKIVLKAREQSIEKPIMKEDNRSLGSTQQFSKINIDNPLHCPHDLTKQSEFRDDLVVLLSEKAMTLKEWKNKYRKSNETLESSKSKYSVFDGPECSDEDENPCPIKFLGPYERYKLVKPFIQAQEVKEAEKNAKNNEQEDDKSIDDRIASLHEHFLKVVKECSKSAEQEIDEKPKVEPEKTPAMIPFIRTPNNLTVTETDNFKTRKLEQHLSLSQMRGVKRKRTNFAPVSLDPNYSTPHNPLHTPVPNMDGAAGDVKWKKPNKRKRKQKFARKQESNVSNVSFNDSTVQGGGNRTKAKKNKNRKRPRMDTNDGTRNGNPSNNTNPNIFQPFDYASVDYGQFQGGAGNSRGNSKQFNSRFRGKNKRGRGRQNNKFSIFKSKKTKI
ncbi:Rrp6 [Trypoxylus dichotomus]